MRAKQLLAYLPKPAHLRLVYTRLTSSRLTTLFTLLSLLHFILQLSFQAWAFSINASASNFLSSVLTQGGLPPHDNFAVLVPLSNGGQTGGELRICDKEEMESHENIYQCPVVWKGKVVSNADLGYGASMSSTSATQTSSSVQEDASVIGFSISTSSITSTSTSSAVRVIGTSSADADAASAAGATDPSRIPKRDDASEDDETASDGAVGTPATVVDNTSSGTKQSPMEPTSGSALNSSIEGLSTVSLPNFKNTTTGQMGIVLSEQCVQMIVWPNQIIHNTKREDATFLAFQCWVLGMSIVALLNESIPHTLAALLTHLLATAWSVYQIFNTKNFQSEFIRSTIGSGRCGGVNLLPGYWSERHGAEVAVLVVNVVSLVVGAFLSWRLVKMFGWQTFKRIGASLVINRVYKIVLVFSIGLQLGFFFVVAAMGLWLDALFNTILGSSAENAILYKTTSILTCIAIAPWLYAGWSSVRQETDKLVALFLALSLLMLAGWGSLFFSSTFRWEFLEWRFFATMTIASSVLLTVSTVLGVLCWYNFDKGLKKFLVDAEDEEFQRERDQFARVYSRDLEKPEVIDFPVPGPIPTYAVAFGNADNNKRSPSNASSLHTEDVESSLGSAPSYSLSVSDAQHSSTHPKSEYSSNETLPPRFRSHFSTSNSSAASTNNYNTKNFKNLVLGANTISRANSTSSNGSGLNPFSMDVDRRTSVSSGFSGRSQGPYKTYTTAGSHHAPTITTMHTKTGSQASWEKKNWVIE